MKLSIVLFVKFICQGNAETKCATAVTHRVATTRSANDATVLHKGTTG